MSSETPNYLPAERLYQIDAPTYQSVTQILAKQPRVQRFPEKALVLLDKCLPKGTHPTLISTRPSSDQFKLKESQNRDCFPPILVDC